MQIRLTTLDNLSISADDENSTINSQREIDLPHRRASTCIRKSEINLKTTLDPLLARQEAPPRSVHQFLRATVGYSTTKDCGKDSQLCFVIRPSPVEPAGKSGVK